MGDMRAMLWAVNPHDIRDIRRRELRSWIDANGLSIKRTAEMIGKAQSYLSETLSGKRPAFGEKMARHIELLLHMPPGHLDGDFFAVARPTRAKEGWPFRFDRRRFDRLPTHEKRLLEEMVLGRIATVEASRGPPIAKSKAG